MVEVRYGVILILIFPLPRKAWATVVHQSRVENAPGIKLKDLAASSTEGTSILAAFRLLLDRRLYPGASRKRRSQYELV